MNELVERLKEYKSEQGIGIYKLSLEMNVHYQTMLRWLTGKCEPDKFYCEVIRRFLASHSFMVTKVPGASSVKDVNITL